MTTAILLSSSRDVGTTKPLLLASEIRVEVEPEASGFVESGERAENEPVTGDNGMELLVEVESVRALTFAPLQVAGSFYQNFS